MEGCADFSGYLKFAAYSPDYQAPDVSVLQPSRPPQSFRYGKTWRAREHAINAAEPTMKKKERKMAADHIMSAHLASLCAVFPQQWLKVADIVGTMTIDIKSS